MSILDELLKVTKLSLPTPAKDEFWEKLVRSLNDESLVDAAAWESLSDPAQDWANAGSRAIRARREKRGFWQTGKKWTGDPKILEIAPLVAVKDPEPEPRPNRETRTDDATHAENVARAEAAKQTSTAPRKPSIRGAGKKKVSKKKRTAKKKALKPASTRRLSSFRTGHCYWFIRHLLTNITSIDDCDSKVLLARFKKLGVNLASASANMMMYDTITVLRVQRDLGMCDHPIVSELPRHEGNAE